MGIIELKALFHCTLDFSTSGSQLSVSASSRLPVTDSGGFLGPKVLQKCQLLVLFLFLDVATLLSVIEIVSWFQVSFNNCTSNNFVNFPSITSFVKLSIS